MPIRLPLCYEDCVAVHKQFCYNDWVLIEEKKEKGIYFKSRGHFRLPNCEELPRYNKTAKPSTCSYVSLTELNEDEITCKCFIFILFLVLNFIHSLKMTVVWEMVDIIWVR